MYIVPMIIYFHVKRMKLAESITVQIAVLTLYWAISNTSSVVCGKILSHFPRTVTYYLLCMYVFFLFHLFL